jgi:exodeoxyribonuclease VII large subunit
MDPQRTVYTPSELNHEARLHLEAGFGRIWLEGEISNLSRPPSGHLYFSLKDDKAQIQCAFFRSGQAGIGFRPENGMQVQARGKVSIYEARGSYQLIVETLEEAGQGRLRAAFEALKKKLQEEGLFDPERKRPLPAYPARIAVVTSPGGAVIRDILNVLKRRWPLAAVRLYPVPVQGEEAPAAIVKALAAANRHGWAESIILCRGGGSLEDLHAFNEESVARAVAASELPVVSAVGHETDFSISDFVADLRAPTPSAAAELVTPDGPALRRSFANLEAQLLRRVQSRLQALAQRHDLAGRRLARQHPGRRLDEQRKQLDRLSSRLKVATGRLLTQHRPRLEQARSRLANTRHRVVQDRRARLGELARTLHAVSPLPTLERGYAIVTDTETGRVLDSVAGIRPRQGIATQLKDGRIHATVERVSDERLENTDHYAEPGPGSADNP